MSAMPDDGIAPKCSVQSTNIRVQKLPVKLYTIVSLIEFSSIITWMPHGRSWKIFDSKEFSTVVMPLFFENNNFDSFVRLVNAWGFRRISSGPDRGSYYHEMFLRGVPHLKGRMRRMAKKEKKAPIDPENEPDFFKINEECPLPTVKRIIINREEPEIPATCQGLKLLSVVATATSHGVNVDKTDNKSTMLAENLPMKNPNMLQQDVNQYFGPNILFNSIVVRNLHARYNYENNLIRHMLLQHDRK